MFKKWLAKARNKKTSEPQVAACGKIKSEIDTSNIKPASRSLEDLLETIESNQYLSRVFLGMGCFFGAEAHLSRIPGVVRTSVGKATSTSVVDVSGDQISDLVPLEVVDVIFDTTMVSMGDLLASFFEHHHCFIDPDIYTPKHVRSCIFTTTDDQREVALRIRDRYQNVSMTTHNLPLSTVLGKIERFNPEEEGLQQYFRKHPDAIEHKRPNALFGHDSSMRQSP